MITRFYCKTQQSNDSKLMAYNCSQKILGLGRVLGVANQNSTHTQNPTFSG